MRVALLQRTLEQTIARATLEEASTAVPSIARADCAHLHRHLFGIVARDLEESDALAFQAALRSKGFETEMVPETELFRLPQSRRGAGIRLEPDAIVETDLYGRERGIPLSSLAFAAAGIVNRSVARRKRELERKVQPRSKYNISNHVFQWVPVASWEEEPEFHLDCFFAGHPMRVDWMLTPKGVLSVNGTFLRFDDQPALEAFLAALRGRLPDGRFNRGIAQAGKGAAPVYPNLASYEEEIVWMFHRLRKPAPA